jgi:hypothetical protein
MINVLIDTCVWLDLAQDTKQTPLLLVIENMVKNKQLNLIVPDIVVDEFQKNRDRVAKTSARSLTAHFQQVKEAIKKASTDQKRKRTLLAHLDDMNHKIPLIGGPAEGVLDRIEAMLRASDIIEGSDRVMLLAGNRALRRRAPCHHENKNSMADAVVVETYIEAVRRAKPSERFAFVTHNKHDFSAANGNQKLPHADLADAFTKIKSMYFITLVDFLRRVDPSLVSELVWEQTSVEEPRGLTELLEAHEELWRQVWYNRHKYREWQIKGGKIKIVPRGLWETGARNNQTQIIDQVWKIALKAAKRMEYELGKGNIGPWTDFEWGMINGKLSAIRWVLGEDWDMLDT